MRRNEVLRTAFLIAGIAGVIEIGTQSSQSEELGFVSIGFLSILTPILGASTAAVITTFFGTIFSFSILWLILALIYHRKIKTLENAAPSSESKP